MKVEFQDGQQRWHLLTGATAHTIESNLVEVTVHGLASGFSKEPELFLSLLFRIDDQPGRTLNVRVEGQDVVLKFSLSPQK